MFHAEESKMERAEKLCGIGERKREGSEGWMWMREMIKWNGMGWNGME